jgi:membrane-associated phospholipid phosphatase
MNIRILTALFGFTSRHVWAGDIAWFFSYPVAYAVPVIFVLYLLDSGKRMAWLAVGLALSGSWLVAALFKLFYKIERPYTTLNYAPIVMEKGFAFPSEHAAVFAALAVTGYMIDTRLGIIFTVLAFIIGVTRPMLGVHYPSDIVVGWIIGIIVGYLVYYVAIKYL